MKKAQALPVNNLLTVVMALVFAGVLLAATVMIMDQGFSSNFRTTETTAENFTLRDNGTYTFSKSNFFGSIDDFALYNWSAAGVANRVELSIGNYTVTYSTGTVVVDTGSEYNGTIVQAEYTYWTGNQAFNATEDILGAQTEVGDWLSLVVIVAIAAIVILIIMQFTKGSSKR